MYSVDLDNLTYTAINGAAKTYLFRNHAGERTITESDGLYKDFTSAIDDYVDFQNAKISRWLSIVRHGRRMYEKG